MRQARAERTHGKTGLTKAERYELAALRKENRVLREEREILKKARAPSSRSRAAKVPVHRGGEGPAHGDDPLLLSACHAERLLCLADRPESARSRKDRRLKVLIGTSFREGRGYYGSPRVHYDLTEAQERVSRKRIIRLMQEDGLRARVRKRYKVTTMSDHDQPIAC